MAGRTAGALLAVILWDWMYLTALYVHSEYWGRGVGSALLIEAEREGCSRGLEGIFLNIFSYQHGTDLYGYQETGQLARFPLLGMPASRMRSG